MFRVGSWLYNKTAPSNLSTQSLDALAESQDLENALRAATLIMNDDVDGAEEGLNKGNSSFHKLGKGIVTFVRATLGLEQDIMRQAGERLAEAESSAYNDQQKSHHHANALNAYKSAIYSPGTEYLLCQSMAQLMAALVGVLNESLTESIKAFYKLRKAYIALDSIVQMEEKYLSQNPKALAGSNTVLPGSTRSDQSHSNGLVAENPGKSVDQILSSSSPIQAINADKKYLTRPTEIKDSDRAEKGNSNKKRSTFSLGGEDDISEKPLTSQADCDDDQDSDIYSNPVDAFVHSGTNLCFGLLLLLISMVPPAFSKLLYIVGFRGDRPRGLRLLWQASRSHSLTGAIAALALLAFYNGFVRCSDILPDYSGEDEEDIEGYPMRRLESLLADMRSRFPLSQLWILEESRMEGANRRLEVALKLLSESPKSPLKQVEALNMFEKSMNAMYLHQYELCAQYFIECVDLNSWSPALYYYIAGASHLEIYRTNAQSSPTEAEKHATKAVELFRKVPAHAGKKRIMARQLPFDLFVARKVAKWESRAKEWKVDFIEAIGVSPIEETIYFANGHSRMSDDQLEKSLQNLSWSESSANKHWHRETVDERAVIALLRASLLRSQRKHGESKEILQSQILCHDKSLFKGNLKDDWTCPSAHYEMAANLWMERHGYRPINQSTTKPAESRSESVDIQPSEDLNPATADSPNKQVTANDDTTVSHDKQKVTECKQWLDKVSKWEAYELDARVGLKVTTAQHTITKWEASHAS